MKIILLKFIKLIKIFNYKKFFIFSLFLIVIIVFKNKKEIKITVFLPIYNMQEFLKESLNSLLKQSYKNIEIIAVNDYSNDNTYEILKEYSLKDKRIIIINNTENRGLLYSRAMGIIHSSGKYLVDLDPDDQFYSSDSLKYLYRKAKNSNADIIAYPFLRRKDSLIYYPCDKNDKIIKHPKLFEPYLLDGLPLVHAVIWNKLIKREIYLKAYKLYQKYIYYKKWNYFEDDIWNLFIHKIASSKLCVRKIIYRYNDNINKKSIMNIRGLIIEYINFIYRFEMKVNFLKNNSYFERIKNECEILIHTINSTELFKSSIKSNNYLKKIVNYNVNLCLKYYNISEEYKYAILNILNEN